MPMGCIFGEKLGYWDWCILRISDSLAAILLVAGSFSASRRNPFVVGIVFGMNRVQSG